MNEIEMLLPDRDVEMPTEPPGFPEGLTGMVHVTPDHIAAGDTVVVDWSAAAPFSGFQFQLNGLNVPPRGRYEYRPLDNSTYRLTATRARTTYSLAQQSVSVDRSKCTVQGKTLTEAGLRSILGSQFHAQLNKSANVRFSNGPLTFGVYLPAPGDVDVRLETDTGLIKVVIPLQLVLATDKDKLEDGGNGMLTITTWISLMLINGVIQPVIARMETERTIPPPIWFAVVAFGLEIFAALELLNRIAPSVLGVAFTPPFGAIPSLFALFGDRVVSVTLEPDPSGPVINTIVCP
jgi:hypothetical protein